MHPLRVVLIGCSESLSPQVRGELLNRRALIEGEYADARHAAANLPVSQDANRVIIVHVRSSQASDQVGQVSCRFAGQPILALLEGGTDSASILAALRAGASQIVPIPLQSEDFAAALNSIAQGFASASGGATVLAVSGAAGGCGATTIAVNLAYEIACTHQLPCILIDLSLKMGTVATYLNVEPHYTTRDLLKNLERLDIHMVRQVLTRVADNFDILAGPKAISSGEAGPDVVTRIIDYAKQLAKVIVLDVPCTYDALYFETLAAADQAVLVGEQKIPSIRTLSLIRDALDRVAPALSQCLVINRYDPKLPGFTSQDVERVLKVSRLHPITNDAVVTAAVNNGRPLRLEAPRSQVLADIGTLARCLLGRQDSAQPEKQNSAMFRRVLRAVGVAS